MVPVLERALDCLCADPVRLGDIVFDASQLLQVKVYKRIFAVLKYCFWEKHDWPGIKCAEMCLMPICILWSILIELF